MFTIISESIKYRIFSIKRPRRLFKNRQVEPVFFSRSAFNRGPAFIIANVRQKNYRANNLEQGGLEVPITVQCDFLPELTTHEKTETT